MRRDLLQIKHFSEDDFEQTTRITNQKLISDLGYIIDLLQGGLSDKERSEIVEKIKTELGSRANLYIKDDGEIGLKKGDIEVIGMFGNQN